MTREEKLCDGSQREARDDSLVKLMRMTSTFICYYSASIPYLVDPRVMCITKTQYRHVVFTTVYIMDTLSAPKTCSSDD